MSKKQKRKVSQPTTAARSDAPVTVAPVAAAPVVRKPTVTYSSEFNPDYTMVKKDLKRIGILAGSFLAILIALSFFLH